MKTALYWFRDDLRTLDLAGLHEACRSDRILGVYCVNPEHFQEGDYGIPKTGPFRARFLLETVAALREDLERLNIRLLVFHQDPATAIADLISKYQISEVHLQREWTRDEVRELNQVRDQLPQGVQFVEHYEQFLFHPNDIPYSGFSDVPNVFTGFRKKCEARSTVRPPLSEPPGQPKSNLVPEISTMPTLEDLGFKDPAADSRTAFPFSGGQQQALDRIQSYFWDTKRLSFYKRTRNGLLGTDYSSKFSPWLANGSLSARWIYSEVKRYEKEIQKNQDTYWMIFELIWRDYFKYVSLKHGNAIFRIGGIYDREYQWGHSSEAFKAWTQGRTKSDFVNANMIELASTGWMSNRGRQNVASYWSGTLKQYWRLGAAWFEYMLLDYDVHSNWGNWMYNSGVGNDPRNRVFNPKLQAERYDTDGRFRRTWTQPSLFPNDTAL